MKKICLLFALFCIAAQALNAQGILGTSNLLQAPVELPKPMVDAGNLPAYLFGLFTAMLAGWLMYSCCIANNRNEDFENIRL